MIAGLRYLLALVGEARYAFTLANRNAALKVDLAEAREQAKDALAAFELEALSCNAWRRHVERVGDENRALRQRVAELEGGS